MVLCTSQDCILLRLYTCCSCTGLTSIKNIMFKGLPFPYKTLWSHPVYIHKMPVSTNSVFCTLLHWVWFDCTHVIESWSQIAQKQVILHSSFMPIKVPHLNESHLPAFYPHPFEAIRSMYLLKCLLNIVMAHASSTSADNSFYLHTILCQNIAPEVSFKSLPSHPEIYAL